MNIVYISKYTIFPESGSPSRQYFLSRNLAKIPGNKVLLIGSRSTLGDVQPIKGLYRSKKEDHLQTVTLNGPKISAGFSLKRLWSWAVFEINILKFRKQIKTFKPDVIIVSSLSILTFMTGYLLKKWLKVLLVVEVRDLYPLTLQEIGNYSSMNPLVLFLKWVEKLGYKHADIIVSTLPNAKEHISNVLKKPFEFLWLPMGVDPNYYNSTGSIENETIFEKRDNEFVVGYAGTLGKANALDVVFEAASHLNNTHPNIKFIFIGDGPLKSMFQEKYSKLKNVTFLPSVPKSALPELLNKTDILINTWLDKRIYRFGISPNKWMDYMYASKPILVAFSGYKCIIEAANCGIFVPAEDSKALIEEIIKFSQMSRAELDKMGSNGKKYLLENLSYELLSETLLHRLHAVKGDRASAI